MSMSLPPSVQSGFTSSPNDPSYVDLNSKEKSQELSNTTPKHGSPNNPGVILTKDSLTVPLEVAFGINNERAGAGRPTLVPLFRTRSVEQRPLSEDNTKTYYQERLNNLPDPLKEALIKNKAAEFEEKDPDLIAEDKSLFIGSALLALLDSISSANFIDEQVSILAQHYMNLTNQTRDEFLALGQAGTQFLDQHLAEIGPNHPSYDTYLYTSNLLKEAMHLLSFKGME